MVIGGLLEVLDMSNLKSYVSRIGVEAVEKEEVMIFSLKDFSFHLFRGTT